MMVKAIGQTAFIKKMKDILENEQFNAIIHWDQSKTIIEISNQQQMEQKILPLYFKHKKLESFVRQLNLYGFKKVRTGNSLKFKHVDLENGRQIAQIKTQRRIKKTIEAQHKTQDSIEENQLRIQNSIEKNCFFNQKVINDNIIDSLAKNQSENQLRKQSYQPNYNAMMNPQYQQYSFPPFHPLSPVVCNPMSFYNPWAWHNNF